MDEFIKACFIVPFNFIEFTCLALQAGAHAQDDLRPAHIVVGIKETPITELDPLTTPVQSSVSKDMTSRTHFMFSHTTKGQPYNMGLLSRFITGHDKNMKQVSDLIPRLVDYELLTETEGGKRTVGFGWFAGGIYAFSKDSIYSNTLKQLLVSLNHFLRWLIIILRLESRPPFWYVHALWYYECSINIPSQYTPRPHTLPSLSSLRNSMRQIGATIAVEGTPKRLGPVVIGLTGCVHILRRNA